MLTILLSTILGINAWVKCDYGYYMDVKTTHYTFYAPLEKITNNYIQVDSNE